MMLVRLRQIGRTSSRPPGRQLAAVAADPLNLTHQPVKVVHGGQSPFSESWDKRVAWRHEQGPGPGVRRAHSRFSAGAGGGACFVLNLSVLGQIFNITPSQNAFLAWAAFALLLAYGYGLRLLLVAGLTSLMAYLAATVGTWSGCYWLSFGERPATERTDSEVKRITALPFQLSFAAGPIPIPRIGGPQCRGHRRRRPIEIRI